MALPRLLGNRRVRRLLGLALTAQGLLGFLAPRLTAKLGARLSLREAYENPGELEPTDAYVELVRDASLATLVFGALTLLRAGSAAESDLEPEGEFAADEEPEPDHDTDEPEAGEDATGESEPEAEGDD